MSLQASVKCTAISNLQFTESNNSTTMTQIPQCMITVPYFPLNTSRNPLIRFRIFHHLSLQNCSHCQSIVLKKRLSIVMQQESKYPVFSPRLQILVGKNQPPWLSTFVSAFCLTVKIILSEWSFEILYQLQNKNDRKNIITKKSTKPLSNFYFRKLSIEKSNGFKSLELWLKIKSKSIK